VLYIEVFDRIVDDRLHVEIDRSYQVGDVTVNEDFAGLGAHHLFRRYPAVAAADIQVVGVLVLVEPFEEMGIIVLLLYSPFFVVFKYFLVSNHACFLKVGIAKSTGYLQKK